jgi:hypothetical protein
MLQNNTRSLGAITSRTVILTDASKSSFLGLPSRMPPSVWHADESGYAPAGGIGDLTAAHAENGRVLWEVCSADTLPSG